jgi:hypothetical protein
MNKSLISQLFNSVLLKIKQAMRVAAIELKQYMCNV